MLYNNLIRYYSDLVLYNYFNQIFKTLRLKERQLNKILHDTWKFPRLVLETYFLKLQSRLLYWIIIKLLLFSMAEILYYIRPVPFYYILPVLCTVYQHYIFRT